MTAAKDKPSNMCAMDMMEMRMGMMQMMMGQMIDHEAASKKGLIHNHKKLWWQRLPALIVRASLVSAIRH